MQNLVISEELSLSVIRAGEKDRIAMLINAHATGSSSQFAGVLACLAERWPARQFYYLLN